MRVEVVRGWTPASPVYTVDRAEGNVVHEIDGVPAVEWYRRFFSVDGAMAPMPDTAYRFPLIIEGPAPERRGLYRTMRHFDRPAGAVTYWGAVQTGDQVHAAAPRRGEVYNLGGGKPNSCSILEAFAMAEEMTGQPQVYSYVDQNRAGDHICYYSDLRKMRSHYPAWDLTRSLTQTLREIVDAWQMTRVDG